MASLSNLAFLFITNINELFCAAYGGLVDKFDLLIGSGRQVTSKVGRAALLIASANGHAAVVRSLLAAGAAVDDFGYHRSTSQTPLMKAAAGGHCKVIKLLLAAGAKQTIEKTDDDGWTALGFAAFGNHTAAITSLLAAGASVGASSRRRKTPLMRAAEGGHVEAIELLLAAGADLQAFNTAGRAPISFAAEKGHLEAVRYLLAAGPPVEACSSDDTVPLLTAALFGQVNVVELLLAAGANIEMTYIHGAAVYTALWFAAVRGKIQVIRFLIKAGASVDAEKSKDSPLCMAARYRHAEVIRELLAAGADPNNRTRYSWEDYPYGSLSKKKLHGPAIFYAIKQKHLDIIHILLDGGANVNHVGDDGCTALIVAANSDPEIVKLLLKAGADPFAERITKGNRLPYLMQKTALDLTESDTIRELVKREMRRRKAAALSVMPARVPLQFKQDVLRLAYSWRPS